MIFFTTFSESGYKIYGKTWVDGFIKNSPKNSKAVIYVDFPLEINHERITIINYHDAIPYQTSFKSKMLTLVGTHPKWHPHIVIMSIKFSYKALVIIDMLSKNNEDYIVWLDGDCEFLSNYLENFAENLIGDKLAGMQLEHEGQLHVESGILIFNTKHKQKNLLLEKYKEMYYGLRILDLVEPYDSWAFGRVLTENSLDIVNLNENYGIKEGRQSDPNLTFLHPEIKKRFRHNIGRTSKTVYDGYTNNVASDEFLKYEHQLYGLLDSNNNLIDPIGKKDSDVVYIVNDILEKQIKKNKHNMLLEKYKNG